MHFQLWWHCHSVVDINLAALYQPQVRVDWYVGWVLHVDAKFLLLVVLRVCGKIYAVKMMTLEVV